MKRHYYNRHLTDTVVKETINYQPNEQVIVRQNICSLSGLSFKNI